AVCASASVLISTKPKPRVLPLFASGTITALITVPDFIKRARNWSFANPKGRRPTKSFLFIHDRSHHVHHDCLHDKTIFSMEKRKLFFKNEIRAIIFIHIEPL